MFLCCLRWRVGNPVPLACTCVTQSVRAQAAARFKYKPNEHCLSTKQIFTCMLNMEGVGEWYFTCMLSMEGVGDDWGGGQPHLACLTLECHQFICQSSVQHAFIFRRAAFLQQRANYCPVVDKMHCKSRGSISSCISAWQPLTTLEGGVWGMAVDVIFFCRGLAGGLASSLLRGLPIRLFGLGIPGALSFPPPGLYNAINTVEMKLALACKSKMPSHIVQPYHAASWVCV